MAQPDPASPDQEADGKSNDLARRLTRYRRRVEAEGRKRSLPVIDRAISEADEEGRAGQGKAHKGTS